MNAELNERAKRVCERYDELRKIGAHGHYETMMQVVREEVERERELCAKIADHYAENDIRQPAAIAYSIRARTKAR